MSEYLWQCPFCNREQTVTDAGRQVSFADLTLANADGPRRLVVKYVVCPDPACRKFSLVASLHSLEVSGTRAYTGKQLSNWDLVPPSRARIFPVTLPKPVLENYHEACLTLPLSHKVSAALSRRCLSEMLRDFWQVQPGGLADEFRQAKGATDPLTWEAIDSVWKTGHIGARWENEVTELLDTESGEAELLIGLIETLIQDWYVGREERRKRLNKLKQVAAPASEEQKQ